MSFVWSLDTDDSSVCAEKINKKRSKLTLRKPSLLAEALRVLLTQNQPNPHLVSCERARTAQNNAKFQVTGQVLRLQCTLQHTRENYSARHFEAMVKRCMHTALHSRSFPPKVLLSSTANILIVELAQRHLSCTYVHACICTYVRTCMYIHICTYCKHTTTRHARSSCIPGGSNQGRGAECKDSTAVPDHIHRLWRTFRCKVRHC